MASLLNLWGVFISLYNVTKKEILLLFWLSVTPVITIFLCCTPKRVGGGGGGGGDKKSFASNEQFYLSLKCPESLVLNFDPYAFRYEKRILRNE